MNQHSPLPRRDAETFIRANMLVAAVPTLPGIRLYAAHPGSGLGRLAAADEDDPPPPYWAYQWAGGLALARHLAECPEVVRGRRVLDLGAGSGLVGIAAAMAGATSVLAAEIDPNGIAAIGLNAELNGVAIATTAEDLTRGAPPAVDVVLVGDLFYAAELADVVTGFLGRCAQGGIEVLVGDPGRAHLPNARLLRLAEYDAADVGAARGKPGGKSSVFEFS